MRMLPQWHPPVRSSIDCLPLKQRRTRMAGCAFCHWSAMRSGGRGQQPLLARDAHHRLLQLVERPHLDLPDPLAADAIDLVTFQHEKALGRERGFQYGKYWVVAVSQKT